MSQSDIYPIAVVQFLIGAIISALNVLLLVVTVANRKLRTSPYFLLGNLWFGNLLLGVIVMVANVVDQEEPIALAKAEGTVVVMNALATLATFLTISTARFINVKTPHHRMALRSVTKILISIWVGIFVLVLIKNIVFTLEKTLGNVCYPCLLGFEAALLLIFAIATILIYAATMYQLCIYKKTSIHDASAAGDDNKYRDTVTLGVLLSVFIVPFIMLIVLLAFYAVQFDKSVRILDVTSESNTTASPDNGVTIDTVATEVILLIFYLHCIVNPLVMICRDEEIAKTAKKIISCQRPSENINNNNGGGDQENAFVAPGPALAPIRINSPPSDPGPPAETTGMVVDAAENQSSNPVRNSAQKSPAPNSVRNEQYLPAQIPSPSDRGISLPPLDGPKPVNVSSPESMLRSEVPKAVIIENEDESESSLR